MFFTLEDYKKIYEWISRNSIKDTEFNEINSLNDEDTIVVVLNGLNARISLKGFMDLLFSIGVSDFLNITDKYKESYISLSQAIELVPYKARKLGQVITFLDEEHKWRIYQFSGTSLLLWNLTSLWKDLISEILYVSVQPDEEDLTGVKEGGITKFKLKDKVYNPDDYSGLGRVYLRKNILEVTDYETTAVITTNLLTLEMISKENTIYVILYDYNLNGLTIVIQEGNILDFLGGSINNGTLEFKDNTKIAHYFLGTVKIVGNPKYVGFESDEEDITAVGGIARLKDKRYNEEEFSGLGRKYLRKNIVVDKNILTLEMISEPNTVYIILYNYDLDNKKIVIPANCTLDFLGGQIINGTVTLNNTKVLPNGGIMKYYLNTNISGNYALGLQVFDVTKNLPKWWTGTKWVDATGADV